MEQLKQMLEAYRNGERPMPTYAELAAIAEAHDALVQSVKALIGCMSLAGWEDDYVAVKAREALAMAAK